MFGKIFGSKVGETGNTILNAVKKQEPVYRFHQGGFQTMGVQTRPQDTRTPEQIDATIDAFADKIPVVKEFRAQIREMKPIDRALIADTVEMSNTYEFLMTPIRMIENRAYDGKSILGVLLPKLIRASKENPEVLKFTQAIIDNTDTQTSKYFLANIAGFNPTAILERDEAISNLVRREASNMRFQNAEEYSAYAKRRTAELEKQYPIKYSEKTIIDDPNYGELIGASADMVRPIAENTINGMYLGTFERQHKFLNAMSMFLNQDVKPENVRFLRKICDVLDKIKPNVNVEFFPFLKSSLAKPQAELNLAQLPQAAIDAEKAGRKFEATDFIMSNVNFIRPQPKIDFTKEFKYVPLE